MSKRPNILFFLTDDQRHNTIAALGNAEIKTPNMDRLVARGTSFTQAHIPCGTCGAICMPSRAMIHTGRTLFHLDGVGQSIPAAHITLGEALQTVGYRTFGTGKWHNGCESFNRSFSDGDEIFFGGMADHWNVPANHYDPSGQYASSLPRCVNTTATNELKWFDHADHITAGKHSSRMVCDATIAFLREQQGDEPFFAYVSFLAPHDPRTMPETFRRMYAPDAVELPPNFAGGHLFDNGELHGRDEELAGFPRTPEETRRHLAEYYAMISHLDAEMGRVLDTLEQTGQMNNTIIVLAGDNGLALGQHGLFGKQNCYEHSVRIPLIFSGPGIPQTRTTDSYAYLLDIFPTLCELADVPIPQSVEGRSLLPAMQKPDGNVRKTLYFAFADKHRAVKKERYKLIEYVIAGRQTMTQLFDLKEDPWEMRNLATVPDYGDILKRLREELRRLREEWDDRSSPWGETFWPAYEEAIP